MLSQHQRSSRVPGRLTLADGLVMVRNLNPLRRLRPLHACHLGRKDVLHVLCTGRHSARSRHVPVDRRTTQYFRGLLSQVLQKVAKNEISRGELSFPITAYVRACITFSIPHLSVFVLFAPAQGSNMNQM